jgi:hypothetical protein
VGSGVAATLGVLGLGLLFGIKHATDGILVLGLHFAD